MSILEFTERVTAYSPTLHALTYRFTRDTDEALDLVQDTLLKALTYHDKFRENTNLKGWLFTIMRNTFINNYRKNQNQKAIKQDSHEIYKVVDSLASANMAISLKEVWNRIYSLKQELSTPLKLHIEGYKYSEIAEKLDIPIGTVKNRIFQARQELQKILNGY